MEQGCGGGDGGGAVDFEGVLAAVVEDDVRGYTSLLVALDEVGEAWGDLIDAGGLPVGGHGVPEDGREAEGACAAEGERSARAEGWTKEADRFAEDGLQFLLGAQEFFAGFAVAGEGEVGVGPGMVGEGVAGLAHLADEGFLQRGVFADEEEGGAGVVAGEDFEKLRGPAGIGTVVEGEGDFAGARGGDERGAVEPGRGPVCGLEQATAGGERGGCCKRGCETDGVWSHACGAMRAVEPGFQGVKRETKIGRDRIVILHRRA